MGVEMKKEKGIKKRNNVTEKPQQQQQIPSDSDSDSDADYEYEVLPLPFHYDTSLFVSLENFSITFSRFFFFFRSMNIKVFNQGVYFRY